jgi:uncharacterized RDD family membrane protein YckC
MVTSRGALTTSEVVDSFSVLDPSVEARARMHSSEPIEPQYVSDSSDQATADESWRAELASRVNNYRRRKRNGGCENSPALDFGPAAKAASFESPGSQNLATPSYVSQSRIAEQSGEQRSAAPPARNAFDTNYYRRLNAESFAQSASLTMGATAAATAASPELDSESGAEFDAEFETESSAGAPDEACNDRSLDLEIRPTTAEDSFLDGYCICEPEPEANLQSAQPAPAPAPQTTPAAQGNLIVFRRPLLEPPLLPQPSRDELAEPMNNRPRILEVPEDIMPAVQGSLFPEIQLDTDEQEGSDRREPEFEIPLPVALVSERLIASLADLGVVMTAELLFAGIALRAMPDVPHTKPFWIMLGAVSLVLWTVYQHLFLLYAGRTPGMSMRGIRLRTFDGRAPEWEQRVSRARYIFVSFASVALGFLWALVDEDTLCWHDRISQTFPTTE